MFKIDVEELEWAGKPLRIETGRMARQADGAVVVTYGETTVLATAVAARSEKPGIDFFPLTVNYQEKTYAAGKIPGGYFKREGRPTEKETLVSRLIDRPIRPLFPEGFRNETQVIATVLSYDLENDSDIVALIGASAALTISGIPFMGPVGGARVGFIDGEFVLNPTQEQMKTSPSMYFDDYATLLRGNFNIKGFYLKPEGIVIYYQQYDIAPYVSGLPEFLFPFKGDFC